MRSPFANCDARLISEPSKVVFRNEEYSYVYCAYECEKTKERFTTTQLDDVNTRQVYNQYREKYGIPFEHEIAKLMDGYCVSASKLSTIMGFGENQIRNYLDGEIPSKANGKALSMIRSVDVFEKYVESAKHLLSDSSYKKTKQRIDDLKNEKPDPAFEMIFRTGERSIFNGYAAQSTSKLRDVILYALSLLGDTYMTKMNKILFYIDMLCYRERGIALTGLVYNAQPYGTIPYRYNVIYSILDIPQTIFYDNGKEFTPFRLDETPKITTLNECERHIIEKVCQKFHGFTSKEISCANHEERAWEQYKDTGRPIPFSESFYLKHI